MDLGNLVSPALPVRLGQWWTWLCSLSPDKDTEALRGEGTGQRFTARIGLRDSSPTVTDCRVRALIRSVKLPQPKRPGDSCHTVSTVSINPHGHNRTWDCHSLVWQWGTGAEGSQRGSEAPFLGDFRFLFKTPNLPRAFPACPHSRPLGLKPQPVPRQAGLLTSLRDCFTSRLSSLKLGTSEEKGEEIK